MTRIGFLGHADPLDPLSWSGTYRSMVDALTERGHEVVALPWDVDERAPRHRLRWALEKRAAGGSPKPNHSTAFAHSHARAVSRAVRELRPDVVLGVACAGQSARLDVDVPIVYVSDATWDAVAGSYPRFSGWPPRVMATGEALEAAAIGRAALCCYPSRWAAESAVAHYGADPAKVRLAPFGSNLARRPVRDEAVRGAPRARPQLLLLGVDWERKGGPVAVEAVSIVRDRGIDAELTVCGFGARSDAAGAHVIPRLSRASPEEAEALVQLLLRSDLLLLPSVADCSPIVLCEAAACGLPAVVTAVGGIPDIVDDRTTGRLVSPPPAAEEVADAIAWCLEPDTYSRLSEQAQRRSTEILDWARWAEALERILREAVELRGRA